MITVQQVINLPLFKTNFTEVIKKHQLTPQQAQISQNIFIAILQGVVNYYELSSELAKQSKIDINKAFLLADDLMTLYNNIVPADIKHKVEAKIKRDFSLIPLPAIKTKFSLNQLSSDARLGEKFLLSGQMPNRPEVPYLAFPTISQTEFESMLATNHNLQSQDFLPESGVVVERDDKIETLAVTLKNKGLTEASAYEAARRLITYVEDRAKYFLAQKCLQRDILLDLCLIKSNQKKTLTWQRPEEITWLQKNKQPIKLQSLSQLRKINFVISNIFSAYTAKILAKNGLANSALVNQYNDAGLSYLALLETKDLTVSNVQTIADNLLLIMSAIESGVLFAKQA